MSGVGWTEQEKEILRKMAEQGKSIDDIAAVLKSRKAESIRMKARHMGFAVYKGGPVEIDMETYQHIMGEPLEEV